MDVIRIPEGLQTTGRYIVTLKDGARDQAAKLMKQHAGISASNLMSSRDFETNGVDMDQVPSHGGVVFEHIGIAVMNASPDAAGALSQVADADSAILAIEPEGIAYALDQGVSREYLRGFRDAADRLCEAAEQEDSIRNAETEGLEHYTDTALATWGLQATRADVSKYTGEGIRVAVLDTGIFLEHPDFIGSAIVGKSFIPGVASINDGNGHGTHCAGTIAGPHKPLSGRRYSVAPKASLYVGKVLSDQGSGGDGGILAGIDWAIANRCDIISMSLAADVETTLTAYETAGQRALEAGCLIVAAAGNNAVRPQSFGFVERPANSRTFMAVGALDGGFALGYFSARDTVRIAGTAVDIAGPGVAVYSSWPLPKRYNTISGTSMATPHVAGLAALWAQKTGSRGRALWQELIVNARTLNGASVDDVGRGLALAP